MQADSLQYDKYYTSNTQFYERGQHQLGNMTLNRKQANSGYLIVHQSYSSDDFQSYQHFLPAPKLPIISKLI